MNLIENWIADNVKDAAKAVVQGCPSNSGLTNHKDCAKEDLTCKDCWNWAIQEDKKIDKAVEKAGEKIGKKCK